MEQKTTIYQEKEFKSILNKHKFIDSWFWDRYSLNPYNGCQFGCVYCDSRSERYHLPLDFENNIVIKKNVGKMLDKRLANARTLLPDVVALSGTCDPYQPIETKFKNTRQCLEILEKHKYPVHIVTKSRLVLKDLDLLENIGKNNWACVSVTITTLNSEAARFLEKKTPSPEIRFDIIKTIKDKTKYIQVGVLLIPVVPVLADSDNDLETMIENAKNKGADYILFGGGMTMRDMQAKWFLKHLKEMYPELLEGYEDLYQFKYNPDSYEGTYEPKKNYTLRKNKKLFALCQKHKIPYRIKRFIPDDFRRENYLIAEKLLNEAYELQILGKAWSNTHWAGQNIQNLNESIIDVAKRDDLQKIRNVNPEIEKIIRKELEKN
ncbi:MAG: radical SAM protein [bacterium]